MIFKPSQNVCFLFLFAKISCFFFFFVKKNVYKSNYSTAVSGLGDLEELRVVIKTFE